MSRFDETAIFHGHECVVLSALMNGADALPVAADDFSSQPNRTIFNRVSGLTNRGLLAVTDALRGNGELERVGGAGRITEIATLPHDEENLKYALDQVLEHSRARQAAQIGERMHKREIDLGEALKQLEKLNQYRQQEKSWTHALDESVVTSSDLRDLELTPRRKLLADWFCEGDLGFIFAYRGVGKTWLALAIAQALSTSGKLGDWQAHERVKVLYIDGEMPPDLMRSRCEGLDASNDNLQFLNHEILFDRTGKVLNVTNREIQHAITERCLTSGVKVLILDNLSTLASGMRENEADSWELVNNWLLDLRRRKIAVVIVHHAGRSGEMRGTSKREDNVFWIIALDDAKKDADDKRGARFVSRFTKPSRNTQEEMPAYEWYFVTDEPTGLVSVGHKQAQTMDVFLGLIEDGVTECGQIAQEMKTSPATISRLAKRAIDAGKIIKKSREYFLAEGQKPDKKT
jgi:putative DNA primase/helicase